MPRNNQSESTEQASTATHLCEKASDMAHQVKDAATEQYEQAREKARQWQRDLELYVHEQPIKSLLIAAGVGVVVGMIMKRR
jgi:ElaB/YqjD/DUF883 family membrane-anchored ribosome-binding protein